MLKIFSKQDFIVNEWSGGKTEQLYIYPSDAKLTDRNFIFRISSATFNCTNSTFSDFSGYQRYLLALQGELSVSHDRLYSRNLSPYDVEYFIGTYHTHSTNSLDCKDFNLIVKDGTPCNLTVLKKDGDYIPKKSGKLLIFSTSEYILSTFSKEKKQHKIQCENIVVIDEMDELYKISIQKINTPVIICEVNLCS